MVVAISASQVMKRQASFGFVGVGVMLGAVLAE